MTKARTAGIAVLSRADIPNGWRPMSDYARQGETVYGVVKKAALCGRIDSYCLFENGRMRTRPRRWVNPAEVEALFAKRVEADAPLFAGAVAAPAMADSQSVVVEAIRLLALEVHEVGAAIREALESIRGREVEPATFGAE